MTLQEVLKKYDEATAFFLRLVETQGKSKETIRNYGKAVRLFRKFFARIHAGGEEVRDPWFLDFQMWRDEMTERGLGGYTMNRYFVDLSVFFTAVSGEDLGELRFYEKNPVPSRLYQCGNPDKGPYQQILEDEEVLKLWDPDSVLRKGVTEVNGARNYAIVMLILATELRNKEILDLRLSDLDFEYSELQVRHGKGDKYRCVDFPEIAQTAVRMYLQSGARPAELSDDDYLFGTCRARKYGAPGETEAWHRCSAQWLTNLVRRHVKAVTGVSDVGPHDLRHVGARLDLHNGMRPELLQAKLGHEDLTTTKIYSGKLGTSRRRVTAQRVYEERDIQTERNRRRLETTA